MKRKLSAVNDKDRPREAKPLARTANRAPRRDHPKGVVEENLEQPDAWGWYCALDGGGPGALR